MRQVISPETLATLGNGEGLMRYVSHYTWQCHMFATYHAPSIPLPFPHYHAVGQRAQYVLPLPHFCHEMIQTSFNHSLDQESETILLAMTRDGIDRALYMFTSVKSPIQPS